VRLYQDAAFRAAFLVTGSAHDAEDAAQDGFVKAFYALPRFRPAAPFRPWLLRIVVNEARNRRKASGRRADLAVRLARDHLADGVAASPEAIALAAEQRALLLRAVNDLRAEDRAVIALRFFLDLNEAEMSQTLGCARGTVKSRLSRALVRLRGAMSGSAGIAQPADGGGREAARG
jgi:RNA polymerase sigma factor (sigma-70 family)